MRRTLALLLSLTPLLANAAFPPSLEFDGQRFEAAWNNGTQFEYVPPGTDMKRWTRMVVLQRIEPVRDAATLQRYVSVLADSYRQVGEVVAHDCVPSVPAGEECRVVGVIEGAGFAELSVSRTILRDGVALNVAIGHRLYGEDAKARQLASLQGDAGRRHVQQALAREPPAHDAHSEQAPSKAPIAFGGLSWHQRWSGDGTVEYTPDGEEDLSRWHRMLSFHPVSTDMRASDLAAFTDRMAQRTRDAGGEVLSNQCAPASARNLPDCTVLSLFVRGGYVELSLSKHVAVRNSLMAISLGRREYGDGSQARIKDWASSSAGTQLMADFIDWVDALALRIEAQSPAPSR